MAYNANLYNPYQPQQAWPAVSQQPVNGLVYIKSVEDGKNYQLPPNSVSPPLMLESDNVFLIKTVDGSGGGILNAYRFEEIDLPGETKADYVTKADFEAFTAKVMEAINGEHAVAKPNE